MPDAWDVSCDLHTVREAHARDLSNSGVRLTRRLGRDLGADPSLKRRRIKSRSILKCIKTAGKREHARLRRFVLSALSRKLIDGGHLEKEDPQGVKNNIMELLRKCNPSTCHRDVLFDRFAIRIN